MNGTHYVRKCKHGIIIEQCKCPDLEKPVLLGPCPDNCPHKNEPAEPQYTEFLARA